MSQQTFTIDNFLALMQQHWPEAYSGITPAFPFTHRITAIAGGQINQIMHPYGLQHSDFHLLTALRRSGEPYQLMPSQISGFMLMTSGGLTKVLTRLSAEGLVERVADAHDKRIKMVKLTAKGKQIIEEAMVQLQARHTQTMQHFDQDEAQQLEYLLEKLVKVMESNGLPASK